MKKKSIFKQQSSMKVVVNGGNYELDDSTVPFQIGFDESIADLQPSHVLVVDITNVDYSKSKGSLVNTYDWKSERTFFKLEPVNYLQIKKPGIHHLIFLLMKDVNKKHQQYFLGKDFGGYSNCISLNQIQELETKNLLCYCEVIVSVSEEFFAPEPKTKWQKAMHTWVNSWYRLKPVDECEYRARKIWAFTLKPILWLFGLIPRVISVVLIPPVMLLIRLMCLVCGLQPVSFLPNKRILFLDFLLLYPKGTYEYVFSFVKNWFGDPDEGDKDIDFYGYKNLVIGKKSFYTPITLLGLIFYSVIFGFLGYIIFRYWNDNTPLFIIDRILSLLLLIVLSFIIGIIMVNVTLPSIKSGREWERKWDSVYCLERDVKKRKRGAFKWIFFPLLIVSVISFIATQIQFPNTSINIDWFGLLVKFGFLVIFFSIGYITILYTIRKFIPLIVSKIEPIVEKWFEETKDEKNQEKNQWLHESFKIEELPQKVDFKTAPKPSGFIHSLNLTFWRTKAKVCRPYAKK